MPLHLGQPSTNDPAAAAGRFLATWPDATGGFLALLADATVGFLAVLSDATVGFLSLLSDATGGFLALSPAAAGFFFAFLADAAGVVPFVPDAALAAALSIKSKTSSASASAAAAAPGWFARGGVTGGGVVATARSAWLDGVQSWIARRSVLPFGDPADSDGEVTDPDRCNAGTWPRK